MLYESDVSSSVAKYLLSQGYIIKQELKPTEKGIDIIAENDNEIVHVEVKGETSFREGSSRYGKPFHSGQVTHHVARALYSTLKDINTQTSSKKIMGVMAFPDTSEFRKKLNAISESIFLLGLKILLVNSNLTVIIMNDNIRE